MSETFNWCRPAPTTIIIPEHANTPTSTQRCLNYLIVIVLLAGRKFNKALINSRAERSERERKEFIARGHETFAILSCLQLQQLALNYQRANMIIRRCKVSYGRWPAPAPAVCWLYTTPNDFWCDSRSFKRLCKFDTSRISSLGWRWQLGRQSLRVCFKRHPRQVIRLRYRARG